MATTRSYRIEFAKRLARLCNEAYPRIPLPNMGRQTFIAQQLGVVPEAVSKWFNAVSTPKSDKMEKLAKLLGVDRAVLAYGDRPPPMRSGNESAEFVRSMLIFAGAEMAPSGVKDNGADFEYTLHGRREKMLVVQGVASPKPGVFKVRIPRKHGGMRVVALLRDAGEPVILDMLEPLIETHRKAAGDEYEITVTKAEDGRFMTDKTPWPRIRSFA